MYKWLSEMCVKWLSEMMIKSKLLSEMSVEHQVGVAYKCTHLFSRIEEG